MGLYLRKALTAGPIRFNLSRSGVGMSLGVKGFRVGAGPRGSYVHAGRGGVYFREALKGSPPAASPTDAVASALPDLPAYPTKGSGWGWALIIFGVLLLLGSSQGGLGPLQGGPFPGAVLGVLLAGVGTWLILRARAWNAAVRRYVDLVQALGEEEAPDRLDEVHALQRRHRFQGAFFERLHPLAYKQALVQAVVGKLERQESSTWPARVGHTLGIPEEQRVTIAVETFRELFWFLVADHDLSPGEETALAAARELFRLPDQAVQTELVLIDEFRRARALLEGPLLTVEADIALQRAEVCHHQTSGALVEERVVRTQQIAGERVKETAWRPVREGRVYVTSKRILVVGDGTTSIPFEKILDIEVDVDDRRIAITKDGRQTPYYLTAVDPIYTGAVIERRHGHSVTEGAHALDRDEPESRGPAAVDPTQGASFAPRWTFTAVAGESHRNDDGSDRQALIRDRLRIGDPVQLVPDPGNEFDRFAIKVCLATGEQIGYLPREVAREVSGGLRRGERYGAIIHQITGGVPGKPTRGVVLDLLEAGPGMTADNIERLVQERRERPRS